MSNPPYGDNDLEQTYYAQRLGLVCTRCESANQVWITDERWMCHRVGCDYRSGGKGLNLSLKEVEDISIDDLFDRSERPPQTVKFAFGAPLPLEAADPIPEPAAIPDHLTVTDREKRIVNVYLKCKATEEGGKGRPINLGDCFDSFALGRDIQASQWRALAHELKGALDAVMGSQPGCWDQVRAVQARWKEFLNHENHLEISD